MLGGANAVVTAADATRGGTYERSFREGQGRGVVFGGDVLHDYVRREYDKRTASASSHSHSVRW